LIGLFAKHGAVARLQPVLKTENIKVMRQYHKWHSENLKRDMEMLVFGHAGARVVVFPTSSGRFFDWENRGMIAALQRHLDNGWIQLFCVDSVDSESWYNDHAHPKDKASRHLQFQDYIIQEVLPFSKQKNDNPFTMAIGASFGAYHSVNIALRFPESFNRVVAMSGLYDVRRWSYGYDDAAVFQSNPYEYIRWLDNEKQLAAIRQIDLIIAIGREDPSFDNNQAFSTLLWDRAVWHAFRVWDGNAHDWPCWQEMILHYIGGPDSRG
jgi:esterase/lipase superfamily enzyme